MQPPISSDGACLLGLPGFQSYIENSPRIQVMPILICMFVSRDVLGSAARHGLNFADVRKVPSLFSDYDSCVALSLVQIRDLKYNCRN